MMRARTAQVRIRPGCLVCGEGSAIISRSLCGVARPCSIAPPQHICSVIPRCLFCCCLVGGIERVTEVSLRVISRRAQTTTTGPDAMGSTSSKSLLAAAMGMAVFMTHAEAFVFSPGLTINSAAARLHVTGRAAPRPALLSLRAQTDSRLGWVGRPGSSLPPTEMQMSEQGQLEIDGAQIFYDFLPGDGPTILFLPALNQTRHGAKANAIKTWCRRQGRSFLVADYYGVGKSDGEYKDATISRWASDTSALMDKISAAKNVEKYTIVGAGVGGWVMLHAAQSKPEKIMGLVGVAADPDFTETLVWPALDDDTKAKVMAEGIAEISWGGKPYTISKALIEDGRKMQLLNKGPGSLRIECPVRLIQGLGDEEIPPERALELSDCISGRDVIITYVKYGKHGLDDFEDDFRRIFFAVEDIETQIQARNRLFNMNRPV